MAFAVRNSIMLGLTTAFVSRIIAIFVGLTAGYQGGSVDRVLMSINDSFVVMPVLPILILLSFLLQGDLSLMALAVILGLFGWAWDARLIRAQTLSLKERAFTRTAVYSGNNAFRVTFQQHLPFVLPIVFATTINNMLWAIGLEVTLSVLGLSNVTVPTIGTTIFWANQHQALGRGHLVVVGRAGACCRRFVPGPLSLLFQCQRIYRPTDASPTDRSLIYDPLASRRFTRLLSDRGLWNFSYCACCGWCVVQPRAQ